MIKYKRKRNIKIKLIAIIMIIQICLFALPQVNANKARNVSDFRDVSPDHWFYGSVKRLYEGGIINGVSENLFAPDAEVKTTEVAALITRYLGNSYLAERSRNAKISNNIEGADLWYSGYIQIMIDMGIFDSDDIERYGLRLADTGSAHISQSAANALEAPVKRMDMVKFVARSFEIAWWRLRSNNILKSDISGSGHEFITGGGYDNATLDSIIPMIHDYEKIPENYRRYFLKCYYNGLVRGNWRGEVFPHDNLRRSEFSRIIAAVIYFDMRSADIRDLAPLTTVTASDYVTSSVNGSRLLKKEKAEQILREQAKFTVISESGDHVNIKIVQQNIIPAGFLAEAYVYMYAEGGNVWEVGRVNGATDTSPYFPKEDSFTISKSGRPGNENVGYVYFLLRDLQRGGEIAGAVMFNITANGSMRDMSVYYL